MVRRKKVSEIKKAENICSFSATESSFGGANTRANSPRVETNKMKKYFEKFGHICELEDDTKLQDFAKKRFKSALFRLITIDTHSILTLQHFNSHSSIVKERKFHKENFTWTVHPFSRFKFIWDIVMVIVFFDCIILGPLRLLAIVEDRESLKNLSDVRLGKFIGIIDMFLQFFVGFVDEKKFAVSFYPLQQDGSLKGPNP